MAQVTKRISAMTVVAEFTDGSAEVRHFSPDRNGVTYTQERDLTHWHRSAVLPMPAVQHSLTWTEPERP